VELLSYAFRSRNLIGPLKLLLFLKLQCRSEVITIDGTMIKLATDQTGLSDRTILNYQRKLMQHYWLRPGHGPNRFFVSGWGYIATQLNITSRSYVRVSIKELTLDFRTYVGSVIIGYWVQRLQSREWLTASRKGRPRKGRRVASQHTPGSQSRAYFAAVLGTSKTTVSRLLKKGHRLGYMRVKHRFEPLQVKWKSFLASKHGALIRKFADDGRKVRLINGQFCLQLTSSITPLIKLHSRRRPWLWQLKKTVPIKKADLIPE
jgi:hypothetical protein